MSTPRLSEEQLAALERMVAATSPRGTVPPHVLDLLADLRSARAERDALAAEKAIREDWKQGDERLRQWVEAANAARGGWAPLWPEVRALVSDAMEGRAAKAERDALRVDRDECLRLLSEERRAKDHAETATKVALAERDSAVADAATAWRKFDLVNSELGAVVVSLRARLEKARDALRRWDAPPPHLTGFGEEFKRWDLDDGRAKADAVSWPKECWVLVSSDLDGGNHAVAAFLKKGDAKRAEAGMHGQAGYFARGITTHVQRVLVTVDDEQKALDDLHAALEEP